MITLYSTGCPKCSVLEKKLDMANIKYKVCNDQEIMKEKGMTSAPALEVNGIMYDFTEAIKFIKSYN